MKTEEDVRDRLYAIMWLGDRCTDDTYKGVVMALKWVLED